VYKVTTYIYINLPVGKRERETQIKLHAKLLDEFEECEYLESKINDGISEK